MIGLDGFGPMLVMLALSLMVVDPLRRMIARAKPISAPVAAVIDDHDTHPRPGDVDETNRLADRPRRSELLKGSGRADRPVP